MDPTASSDALEPDPSSGPVAVHLAPLLAAAATGDVERLEVLLQAQDRVAPSLIREALLLLVPFAGVPRSLDALQVFARRHPGASAHLEAPSVGRETGSDARAVFRVRGEQLFARVYGPHLERVSGTLRALDPELLDWVLEDAYGKVLARGFLPPSEVECLAVVLLAAQGLTRQLKGHVAGALRCGASPDDVRRCLVAAAAWIAEPVRTRAEHWLVQLS
jgi:4-carboxymuconolactone decarboxylase